MGRAPLLTVALALACSTGHGTGAAETPPARPVAVRLVKLGGEATDPRVLAHVEFCREAGFNALWIYAGEAGVWGPTRAPRRPIVDKGFVAAARTFTGEGLDLWFSINPVADDPSAFVFSDRAGEDRIVAFATRLRKTVGLRHLVISFDDQPLELTELRDVLRYGRSAAPAHLDLVRRVAARLPTGLDLWMCAASYCDAHLGDGKGPYSGPFLEGLGTLPERVGIVWTGPKVTSPTITRADIEGSRARLGGRRILLYDNAFSNSDDRGDGLALLLAPLQHRDPALGASIAGYLASPMSDLGGSRLALATTADWLADPDGYDPDVSLQHAMVRLAGAAAADPDAWAALRTQQMEWGGFVGERNYGAHDLLNASAAGARLDDPAFVSSFTWTVERYPNRMAALSRMSDAPFRDAVLTVMRRRLAVARAIPLTIEYLVRLRAGRKDADVVKARIDAERASWSAYPDAGNALEAFLAAAHVQPAAEASMEPK